MRQPPARSKPCTLANPLPYELHEPNIFRPVCARKVQILERDETMGDILTRRTAVGKRYASNVDV